MPVLKCADGTFAFVNTRGRVGKILRACVIRDPHFNMRQEVNRFAALTGAFVAVTTVAAFLLPGPQLGSIPILALVLPLLGLPYYGLAVVRIVSQWLYRRGLLRGSINVLDQTDPWLQQVSDHVSPWPAMVQEMEQTTNPIGRKMHGIMLSNLQQVNDQRLAVESGIFLQWDIDTLGKNARDTARKISVAYEEHRAAIGMPA
jgi:hypothetical protein